MVVGEDEAAHIPFDTSRPSTGYFRPQLLETEDQHDVNPLHAPPMHIDVSPLPMAAEIALTALSTLPTPILVLSSLKTVLLGNTALGRLLGIDGEDGSTSVTDALRGQTLSQLGIDMVSDGVPIWVSWEKFLDSLANGLEPSQRYNDAAHVPLSRIESGDRTPTASPDTERGRSPPRTQAQKTKDAVVDVVISSGHDRLPLRMQRSRPHKTRRSKATCRMIISIWSMEGQRFFTLTFTSSARPTVHSSSSSASASSARNPSSHSTRSSLSSHSHSQIAPTSAPNSQVTSPSTNENSERGSFPSIAPPPQCSTASTMTDLQKVLKMKNAMLKAIEIPLIAMWRDESVVFPNLAARKLLKVETDPTSDDSYDFMSRFKPWNHDFSYELDGDTNPMLALCRTQQAFTNWQIGLIDERTGKKSTFDVSGHPVFDERSGKFLAGLVTFKDVTEYTEQIAYKTAENEEQFSLICDMMPQMIWTSAPNGDVTYWSQRWYDYTGLSPEVTLGPGWQTPFHEDDMTETAKRWTHSLATGVEYATEYRCRRSDGVWRWMLGRALPLRDHKTGEILRWFGTCTDIQDIVDAKLTGQQARQQLLDVLKHSQMTLWILDRDWKITFYEGDSVMNDTASHELVGKSVLDVVGRHLTPKALDSFRAAFARILSGESDLEILENEADSRWFRSKMVPMKGKPGPNGVEDEDYIAGVIVIGSDVTSMRRREQENVTLLANETAAKEASKMKSSFLANMSHEIRTPIAGVLGMSELLMDTKLDLEQSEFAQNIQRSANSLLTVINDILDFSKIESGRLDIEEVQFSLGVVLQDVAKMLSFAAQRKGLQFSSHIRLGPSNDTILLGDPGRIRQILVNLLTNSIKFTSEGYVKMSADILHETTDTVTVQFCVEDSGIGIEEEVKKRLFRPFSQADSSTARRFGGTGLGLTISKNLVDLMRGTIGLESKLDAGTRATFTIPFKRVEYQGGSPASTLLEVGSMPDRLQSDLSLSIAESPVPESRGFARGPSPLRAGIDSSVSGSVPAVQPRSVQPVVAEGSSRQDVHILVVEDNAVNQQIALKFIKALKFSATAVWNGKEALEYLLKATSTDLTLEERQEYRLPSLILMDVQMPVLDGYHATHMLRHHAPFKSIDLIRHIPIVAMTASAIQGDREKCERAGMDDYMAKPVKRSLLESTILKWVTRGRNGHEPRKSAVLGASNKKPALGRACTDHSSTCTENDAIVTDFYARNGTSIGQSEVIGDDLPLPMNRDGYVHGRAAARRSSISRAILESTIPGQETEGDRAVRRAAAEDLARTLRDAKLLSATENERRHTPPVVRIDESLILDSATSESQKVGTGPSTSPMALTEENVLLLNHVTNGDSLPHSASPPVSPGSQDLAYPLSELPGPPPEGTHAAIDLSHVNGHAEALVSSILEMSQQPTPSERLASASATSTRPVPVTRQDLGALGPGRRIVSDRSSTTARP